MTYIKLIFLFILMLLDRCGVFHSGPGRQLVTVERVRQPNNRLDGSWRLADVNGNAIAVKNKADSLPGEGIKKDSDLLLSFFPDSTFTQINEEGEFVNGRWSYNKQGNLVLMRYNEKTEKYKVFYKDNKGLRMATLKSIAGKDLELAGFGKSMEEFRQDPFYLTNNKWRIKPQQSETDKEIRHRLIGYIEHSAYLLKAAEVRKQQFISWEFSKGIIKIYNGGIGLFPKEQMPDTWSDSFYSKEDALKAYEMFEGYLRNTSYKGKSTGNWVTTDYNILVSVADGLKRNV